MMIEALIQDVRYAVRSLVRTPGFALTAVLTLAIGIGANTAIYSLARTLILKPIPIPEPERVVLAGRQIFSYLDYLDVPQATTTFSGAAIFQGLRLGLSRENADAEEVRALFVSPTYFTVLNISAVAGRTLQAHDARTVGEAPVAVLSYSAAVRQFGSAESAVGKQLRLGNQVASVVGVTPSGFAGTDLSYPADVFIPVTMFDAFQPRSADRPTLQTNKDRRIFDVLARLQPGVTAEHARKRIDELVVPGWGTPNPRQPWLRGNVVVEPINEQALPDRPAVLNALNLLAAMVAIMLLVACANVTSLLLSRMDGRRTEFGIRVALGGSGLRLARQLAAETLLLSGMGGLLAIALTTWSLDALNSLKLDTFLPPGGIQIERTALLACAVVTLLTAIVCTMIPWIKARHTDPLVLLKASSGGSPGRDRARFRSALVVGQIAAALVLVVGTMLLVRTLKNQLDVDLGFDPDPVVIVEPNSVRHGLEAAERVQEQLVARLEGLPHVRSVSLAAWIPLSHRFLVGVVDLPDEKEIRINLNYVDPDYFETLGIAFVAGRPFTSASAPNEVVVNEAFARRFAHGSDVVGQTYATNQGADYVVGVIRDIKTRDLQSGQPPFLYRRYGIRGGPHAMTGTRPPSGGTIHIRSSRAPEAVLADVRAIVREIDPQSPLTVAMPLREHVDRWLAQSRSLASVVSVFGFVAVLLAAVGLYGLNTQLVNSQRKELGIRIAMGAQPVAIRRQVLARSVFLTLIGLVSGGFVTFAIGQRIVGGLLFGVAPTDPLTIALACFALLSVSCIASYLPAQRASRVDPAQALRTE